MAPKRPILWTADRFPVSTQTNSRRRFGALKGFVFYADKHSGYVGRFRGEVRANKKAIRGYAPRTRKQLSDAQTAEEHIVAANIPQQVSNLSKFKILDQSGISALAQASSAQQSILSLQR